MKLSNYLFKTALMAFCINLAVAPAAQGMQLHQQQRQLKSNKRYCGYIFLATLSTLCWKIIQYKDSALKLLSSHASEKQGLLEDDRSFLLWLQICLSCGVLSIIGCIDMGAHSLSQLDKTCEAIAFYPPRMNTYDAQSLALLREHAFSKKDFVSLSVLTRNIENRTLSSQEYNQLLNMLPTLKATKQQLRPVLCRRVEHAINHTIKELLQKERCIAFPSGMHPEIINTIADYVEYAEPVAQAAATPDVSAERKADHAEVLAAQPGLGLGGQADAGQERAEFKQESKRQAAKQKED